MEAPPPYPGLNTAPQQYSAYPQMAFPAYGINNGMPGGYGPPQANGPFSAVIIENGAQASAPPAQPVPPGFVYETPPSYAEATKKNQ